VTRIMALVFLALAACAGDQPTVDQLGARLPPAPANTARIFVYRDFQPYQSLEWVPVFFNGVTTAAVGPGKVIVARQPKPARQSSTLPVGTGGGRPPPVTRWAPSNGVPTAILGCRLLETAPSRGSAACSSVAASPERVRQPAVSLAKEAPYGSR
jgi:hypothetical protein